MSSYSTKNSATATGSERDSISSLSARTADMAIGGSSSPFSGSTQASEDEGDITVVKDAGVSDKDGDEDEEGLIPFLDKNGKPVNEDTPPDDFVNWPAYLVYCKNGAKLKIRLAVLNEDGDIIAYRKVEYSKKLLCDHSGYFQALYRSGSGMLEFMVGYVDFDDIDIVDFERLMMLITSGHPGANYNIGPTSRTLSDLLQCSMLCDRLDMPMINAWAKNMMEAYMLEMGNWAARYHHEVIANPTGGLQDQHKDRVMDLADAYSRSCEYPAETLPVQMHRYVKFLTTSCPRILLADLIDELPTDMVLEITKQMLVPS